MSDEEYNYFGVYTKNNENMKPSEIVANMSDDHTDSSGSLNAYDLIVGNSSRPLSRKETKEKLDNFILTKVVRFYKSSSLLKGIIHYIVTGFSFFSSD